MQQVHEYMTLPPDFQLREVGTQEYEADVVTLERYGGNTVQVAGQRTNTFVNEMSRKSSAGVHTCVCVYWTRCRRARQIAATMCAASPRVQRRPAHQRHAANDGRLLLPGGVLQR